MELRAITDADLPTFYEHQADPAVSAMAGFKPRSHDAFFVHWRTKVLADPANTRFAVVADGVLAGNVVAFDREGKRLVGYWYGRAHWGRGIASEALRRFLTLETQRPLCAWVIPSNRASMRVLEKHGFVRGELRVDHEGVEELLFTLL
ncbi:MAG: GNAT family N-acetyltransferase [Myxococcaceae bacterium]|nr:GNAT family N-acetyltransferase [Myxococcaceae bacterium]